MNIITIEEINAAINIRSERGLTFNFYILSVYKDSGISIIEVYKHFCKQYKNLMQS